MGVGNGRTLPINTIEIDFRVPAEANGRGFRLHFQPGLWLSQLKRCPGHQKGLVRGPHRRQAIDVSMSNGCSLMFFFLSPFLSLFNVSPSLSFSLPLKSIRKTYPQVRDCSFRDRFLGYVTREVFLKRAEPRASETPMGAVVHSSAGSWPVAPPGGPTACCWKLSLEEDTNRGIPF